MISILLMIFVIVLGLFFGNFGTSYYYRIVNDMPINGIDRLKGTPPHCSVCKHPLKFYEYFPIFNWFYVKNNKCNYCGVTIDPVYHIFEIGSAVMAMVIFLARGIDARYPVLLLFSIAILLMGFLFYRKNYIQPQLVFAASLLGYLDVLLFSNSVMSMLFTTLLIFIHAFVLYARSKDENLNFYMFDLGMLIAVWSSLYVAIPLFLFIYCLYHQQQNIHKYIYFIGLLLCWILIIL